MNIIITPKAETFIKRMIRFNGGTPASGFRLLVSPGGCSGFNSSFTVENTPLEGDAVLTCNGVKVFLPAESRIMLQGVTVDYSDTPMSSGLSFIIPNAQACVCSSAGPSAGAMPQSATVSIASLQRWH